MLKGAVKYFGTATSISNNVKLSRPQLVKNNAFIGGEWVSNGTTFPVCNPATNSTIAQVWS